MKLICSKCGREYGPFEEKALLSLTCVCGGGEFNRDKEDNIVKRGDMPFIRLSRRRN